VGLRVSGITLRRFFSTARRRELPRRTTKSLMLCELERTVIRHRLRAPSAAAPLCARGAHDSSARGRSTAH